VSDFAGHEVFRNDANGLSARLQNSIGDSAHQTNISPAIDEPNIATRELGT